MNYMNIWIGFHFSIKNKVAKQLMAPQLMCTGLTCAVLNSLSYFKLTWMFTKEQLHNI